MEPSWARLLGADADVEHLLSLRQSLNARLADERWKRWREGASAAEGLRAGSLDICEDVVRFGRAGELNAHDQEKLDQALKAFLPWKKGPYEFFGQKIDSEWRSDLKWQRVKPFLSEMKGQIVADIGSHNGYYMYHLREMGAKNVIGFEPMPINYFNHQLMQTLYPTPEINVELFGVEHIDLFPDSFDTILCMGILYHHTDPVGLLRKMRIALKQEGRIIIDCQGIAGDDTISLTPTSRYAGATGVWYLPTMLCLQNWIRRAGFSKQIAFYSAPLDSNEQRATSWANVKSLSDFLDPLDKSRTVEGHPAPWRHYVMVKI
jgi:tRNA (mo5U34)-methyltransferase